MKKSVIVMSCILIITIFSIVIINLLNNKTFFKTTYIGVDKQEIFIPRFSYFESECCMTAATFYTLRSKKDLDKEISNYLKDFEYFESEETYGYKKDNLFIQKYYVLNKGIYRKIIIVY